MFTPLQLCPEAAQAIFMQQTDDMTFALDLQTSLGRFPRGNTSRGLARPYCVECKINATCNDSCASLGACSTTKYSLEFKRM